VTEAAEAISADHRRRPVNDVINGWPHTTYYLPRVTIDHTPTPRQPIAYSLNLTLGIDLLPVLSTRCGKIK